MKLTLDVENTDTKLQVKIHLDPFEPENSLTMIGVLTDQGLERHFPFDHADEPNQKDYHNRVQWFLDEATVLIMHNAAHDLLWLWESGFKYDGPVFDTMLAEYVLQRGQKKPLSLEACAERYELETQKEGTLKEYIAKGYSKLPKIIQSGTSNFTSNIATLLSIPNSLLQGNIKQTGHAAGSFLLNSTF